MVLHGGLDLLENLKLLQLPIEATRGQKQAVKKEMKALKAAVRREQTSSKHPNKDPQNTQQRS